MDAAAGEAEEDAEFGGGLDIVNGMDLRRIHCSWLAYPLRRGGAAVDAFVVLVCFGDGEEFGAGFGVDFPHFGGHVGGMSCFSSVDCEDCDRSAIVASLGFLEG